MIGASEAGRACDGITAFVRSVLDASHRSGMAVGMSGGLDSSVTGALREMGVYDFVLSRVPGEILRAGVVRAAYGLTRLLMNVEPLTESMRGSDNAVISQCAAHFKARHRMRMVFLYFRAERMNLMVAGAANRTEVLTGIYSRFGVDDCADIMPVGGLLRTEVLRLAEHLDVPAYIRSKTPAPGIIPGVTDKYRYLLGLDSHVLDEMLEALDSGAAPADVAAGTGVDIGDVERVVAAMAAARAMRAVPPVPGCA